MGRQIMFHALPEDCIELLSFIQERDPVVITERDSTTAEVKIVVAPCAATKTLCLWNQSFLPTLTRDYVPNADSGPYYRVNDGLPVLELSTCLLTEWEGSPALVQGRIWGAFKDPSSKYNSWYGAIVRWIRKTYVRNDSLHGYTAPSVGPWQSRGGILLPMFKPPVTAAWRKFVEDQRAEVMAH